MVAQGSWTAYAAEGTAPRAAPPWPLGAWGPWGSWATSVAESAHRARRDLLDAALYDLSVLDPRSRQALQAAEPGGESVIVVAPSGGRPAAVYRDAAAWRMSIDGDARVLALIADGSSVAAAAAFARQTADALGEPVVTAAPPRELGDVTSDLVAPFGWGDVRSWARPRPGLEAVLQGGRSGLALIATHGRGAQLLDETGAAARTGDPAAAPFIACFAGAARIGAGRRALLAVGAQDVMGWSLSPVEQGFDVIAPLAGASVNPKSPGALPFAALLGPLRSHIGPPARRRGVQPSGGATRLRPRPRRGD